jgi:4-amino-4-deoxy-L-arabinose transferase-like glycosyltransferase
MPMQHTTPRILLVIIGIALVLRLGAFGFALGHSGKEALMYGDAAGPEGYIALAQQLAQGQGFSFIDTSGTQRPEVFRTPGLPLLLVPFSYLSQGFVIYGLILAVLAGTLLPWFTFLLGRRLVGIPAALIAAFLVAIEPHLVFFSFVPQTEIPFMLCMLSGLAAAFRAVERQQLLFSAFAGSLFGYAILIRPGFLTVFLFCILAAVFAGFRLRAIPVRTLVCIAVTALLILFPWYLRTYSITTTWALSGVGWRNVYTDYVASVRAIERQTDFASEKSNLREEAETRYGLSRYELNSPAAAHTLRSAALSELWQHKITVAKLEAVLLSSFFLQDGYYYAFVRYGFIANTASHTSATLALLSKGFAGISDVLAEMKRQYFIPILGRIVTLGLFMLAGIGFFMVANRIRFLYAGIILLTALTSTAIGLGVEARLRLPIEPFLFILAGAALHAGWTRLQTRLKTNKVYPV